jgi:hypothetical protein
MCPGTYITFQTLATPGALTNSGRVLNLPSLVLPQFSGVGTPRLYDARSGGGLQRQRLKFRGTGMAMRRGCRQCLCRN